MTQKIGTLADRINNRLVRYFPGPTVQVEAASPIVSFTFDDVPESSWTNGARILEEEGARGTFYISGNFVDGYDNERKMVLLGAALISSPKATNLPAIPIPIENFQAFPARSSRQIWSETIRHWLRSTE